MMSLVIWLVVIIVQIYELVAGCYCPGPAGWHKGLARNVVNFGRRFADGGH